MTLEEFKNGVIDISKLANDNEEIMNRLKTLQAGFEDEVSKHILPPETAEDGKTWELKYQESVKELEAVKQRYRERFFEGSGADVPPAPEEVRKEITHDLKAAENRDYSTLFAEVTK